MIFSVREPDAINNMGTETNPALNCSTYEQIMKSRNPMNCGSLIPETDRVVLDEIQAKYHQGCVDCICYSLSPEERRVIYTDENLQMRDYCAFARLKVMSDAELKFHDHSVPLPEFLSEFTRLNKHWLQREMNFLAENLRTALGRAPTEKDIAFALADELNKPGKSHAARFRAYYAIAFPSKVERYSFEKQESESEVLEAEKVA